MPFTFTRLARNTAAGQNSGPAGYTSTFGALNFINEGLGSNWNAGSGGLNWFATPNFDPDVFFVVAACEANEPVPTGPWTWFYANAGYTGNGGAGGGTSQFAGRFTFICEGVVGRAAPTKGFTAWYSWYSAPLTGVYATTAAGNGWGAQAALTGWGTSPAPAITIVPVGTGHMNTGLRFDASISGITARNDGNINQNYIQLIGTFGSSFSSNTDFEVGQPYAIIVKSSSFPQTPVRPKGELSFWRYATGTTAGGSKPRSAYTAGEEDAVINWLNGIPRAAFGFTCYGTASAPTNNIVWNPDFDIAANHTSIFPGATAYWWSFTSLTGGPKVSGL